MEKPEQSVFSMNVIKQLKSGSIIPTTTRGRRAVCQQTADVQASTVFPQLNIKKDNLPTLNVPIEQAQKWLALPGKNGKLHKFPQQTMLPKVQMTRNVPSKQIPRDVEIDRRRRQYAKIDLEELLLKEGITNEDLLPSEEQYFMLSENAFKHYLPIGYFDDTTFACHSPEAWLKLGLVDNVRYPLPAKAYLPYQQSLMEYRWQYTAVTDYNEETDRWTCMILMDERVYEVPKIQIMFLAENPNVFVTRLKKAVAVRNTAECLILMEAIVDCVLLEDMYDERFAPNPRIERLISTFHGDASFMRDIRTEVYLVFEHLMALYEFEKFIIMMPKEFPAFRSDLIRNSLPKAFDSILSKSERKKIQDLQLNMKTIRHDVLSTILYYIPAGIEAMENVAMECAYVETLLLFVVHFAKPLPLNDFLNSQQQHSNNVAAYLKNYWPSKTSSGITIVLRALGKGWLDIALDKWKVYQMSKVSRFILQTKFRMQESMQVLLEKSIDIFSHFLCDPCEQFLSLTDKYKWPADDFINTPFPWPKPVFSLIIGISPEENVFYSTPPEDFEFHLTEIFKKALEKTSGVRCIDGETMTNLRFAPNLYILTVELVEELFIIVNAHMAHCYNQSTIPLLAYAKLFERFIPFYVLNLSDYMQEYEASAPSSLMVRSDILEHKRMKELYRAILPATIVIGPFLIHVDPMKQYLIKKRIDIVRRLFEYYVQRMFNINERLLDECIGVYNKISERPQSIEHLYEIRDFSVTVPERVEQLRADIQIMWLEYELLDSFFYNLSDTQFSMKWEVYAYPHNILQRLSTLREEQKNDIDEFRRLHLSEVVGFEERLESLNEEVQAYSLMFDPEKFVETSVEVKKTWKAIQEVEKMGKTLQFRQTLFEMEELSLEFLESILDGFNPYRNLWTACVDTHKVEEATTGNPIVNIEYDDVRVAVQELRSILEESERVFEEKEEIQQVAHIFLERLEAMNPILDCIEWLRNENWLFMHWQELANRSGMEIKYSAAMNFSYLIRKGIMEHLDLVKEISAKAEEEADEIRRAMEEEERLREEQRLALLYKKEQRKCRRDIL